MAAERHGGNVIFTVLLFLHHLIASLEGLHTPEPWSRSTRFRSAFPPDALEHIQSMISDDIAEANNHNRRSILKRAAILFPSYTTVLPSSISNAIVIDTDIVPTIIEATHDKVTVPIDYIPALGAYVSNQQSTVGKKKCYHISIQDFSAQASMYST